jgi:hypothetical protein
LDLLTSAVCDFLELSHVDVIAVDGVRIVSLVSKVRYKFFAASSVLCKVRSIELGFGLHNFTAIPAWEALKEGFPAKSLKSSKVSFLKA